MATATVLGTVQDGGFPHAGCVCDRCEQARRRPGRSRRVACLGLVDGSDGFLVDATPDLPRQLPALPHLAGILLTHAHMGHVAGLLWLGKEAMAVRDLPVWLGPRLHTHLSRNEPWATMIREGGLAPRIIEPGVEFSPSPGLVVAAVPVPHRGEWSETWAFRVAGGSRTLLWLPDIDRFEPGLLERLLHGVDLAFLDGTFWSDDELPGRNLAEIPHPRIAVTARELASLRPSAAVSFVHMNHSNPCLDPDSAESIELARIYDRAGLVPVGETPVAGEDLELAI
jgi:pyrroloquinoline quinone biosynthesis protein B